MPSRFLRASIIACLMAIAGCMHVAQKPSAVQAAPVAVSPPPASSLSRRFSPLLAEHPDLSGFHVLQAGVDGLAARIQLIRSAERTLELQYFIFRGDATGRLVVEELRRAADRGVHVRVIVDDGDTVSGDEQVLQLDGNPSIEVRVFNPFDYRGHNRVVRNLDYFFHKSQLDYRMHNKLMVVDGAVALIGGRNIGDQYFQVDPDSQFADDDVFTVGPAVTAMTRSFEEFWNSEMVVPAGKLRMPAHREGRASKALSGEFLARVESGQPLGMLLSDSSQLTWASGRLLYDSPYKMLVERRQHAGRLMSKEVEDEIDQSHSDLVIVSPYFVPSDKELGLLEGAKARNAEVRILTNSMESNPEIAAHSGYQKVRVPLLKSGAKIFEVRALLENTRGSGQSKRMSKYGNYALHGKMYVFDSRRVFLGSWNYDQRSLRINTEIGILIDSPVVAGQVISRFNAMVQPPAAYALSLRSSEGRKPQLIWSTEMDHHPVELTVEPSRGKWQRIKAWCLARLPLQAEL